MIKFITSATKKEQFPLAFKADIVIVGRSNTGKSSLINALFNSKIAHVGKTPGKTKLINFFEINEKYYLVDLPGYGYAKLGKNNYDYFARMMDEYFDNREFIKLVLIIIDIRRDLSEDDLLMIDYLKTKGINYLFVLNKMDKLNQSEKHHREQYFNKQLNEKYLTVSALKKRNINLLLSLIENCL